MFGKKSFKNRKIELLHSLTLFRCNSGIRRWFVTKGKKVVHEGKKNHIHILCGWLCTVDEVWHNYLATDMMNERKKKKERERERKREREREREIERERER